MDKENTGIEAILYKPIPENEDTVHGRLLESVHVSGYSFERAGQKFEWLLDKDRWKNVGPGFENIDDFISTIDFSGFKVEIKKRKKIAKKLASLRATQRASAKMLGVSEVTVARDIGKNRGATNVASGVNEAAPIKASHIEETTNVASGVNEAAPIKDIENDIVQNRTEPEPEPASMQDEECEVETNVPEPEPIVLEAIPVTGENAAIEIKKMEEKEVRKAKNELQKQKNEALKKDIEPLKNIYDVVVIDPPWPIEKIERDVALNQTKTIDYPTMTVEKIKEFKIPANEHTHLFLWTTQKFLPVSFEILEGWEFRYICAFTWHKKGGFQPFGLPQYNSEFCLYARKGTPKFIDTKSFMTCFEAPRRGHSIKPIEFYETVRRVTDGQRVDIFNREPIPGFDSWGFEA